MKATTVPSPQHTRTPFHLHLHTAATIIQSQWNTSDCFMFPSCTIITWPSSPSISSLWSPSHCATIKLSLSSSIITSPGKWNLTIILGLPLPFVLLQTGSLFIKFQIQNLDFYGIISSIIGESRVSTHLWQYRLGAGRKGITILVAESMLLPSSRKFNRRRQEAISVNSLLKVVKRSSSQHSHVSTIDTSYISWELTSTCICVFSLSTVFGIVMVFRTTLSFHYGP